LVSYRELLHHGVIHFHLFNLAVKVLLLFIKFILELFDLVSCHFSRDLEIILIFLLLSEVFSLLIVELGHQFHELGVTEKRILGQSIGMLDLALNLFGVMLFLSF
jgi:hypothetical protein